MRYLFAFLILVGLTASAQRKVKVGIVGLAGYTFRATYYGDYAQISFKEGPSYGGMLVVSPNEHVEIGLMALHQDSKADQEGYYPPTEERNIPVGLNSYMLSIIKNFPLPKTDKVVPYAGIDLGIMDFRKTDGSYSTIKAAWGLKAGLKVNISEAVHLRLQAQMEMPIAGIGAGIGVGTGGASVGAYGYSSMVQFAFIGGIGYTFGTKKAAPAPEPAPATTAP